MSVSKLKTITIAALVLINVMFLTFIIIDAVAYMRSERVALANVGAVLQAGGIYLSLDDVFIAGDLRTMRTTRSADAEAIIANALLGPTEMTDYGVIYLYENRERGTAEFASGGDFEILLNEGVITNDRGTLATVRALLREMKVDTSWLELSYEQGGEVVSAANRFKGASIFNCTIEFVFVGDSLRIVRGRYVSGFESAESGSEISSISTALLGFLAAVRNDDIEDVNATRIDSVEAGFHHRVVGAFGEGVIEPAWLISTDFGRFLIDDATGEVLPFA